MIHKTTRSILSVLLAALLLVTSTPLTPAFADGGGVSLQSESGEGRVLEQADDGVYYISTAEQLEEFADIVNGTAEGIVQNTSANAKLMNDIDLNGSEENPWTPIGNIIDEEDLDSFGYTGTFDGAGHTISGLYINSSSADFQGLFGHVGSSGKIENLSVSGSVSGNNFVGGVVGYNGGTVENCYNTGTVTGNNFVGGIVGNNYPGGSVTNCYNTGSVSGPDSGSGNSVGGVVGYNGSGIVTNSYNTGEVSGNNYVGGVVGLNGGGSVEKCYNIGEVSGPDNVNGETTVNVGGVVGLNSGSGTVKNCYNAGSVTGVTGVTGTDDYVGGVVGQNYLGASVTNCYNTGSVTSSVSPVGGVVGMNDSTVTGCYFLKDTAGSGIGNEGSAAGAAVVKDLNDQDQFKGWDFIDTWRISQSLGFPVLQDNAQDGLPPGLGTEASPYEISTADELKNFATAVNDGSEKSAHAKLMNNIDLNPGITFNADGTYSSPDEEEPHQWTPIGTYINSYKGTFDGNEKTISGLYINDSTADDQGLFGYVGTGGTVKDLTVSGSVSGDWYVGGVVGNNNGGTVTGCIFSGSGSVSVTGSYYVGGVVGDNRGTVENCYNTGTVTGTDDYVGGVVGYSSGDISASASVTNCYNTGAVSGGEDVGGVVGHNSSDVGDNSSNVENCYNTGKVTGSSSVGGVVGDNSSNGNVENCYNTGNVSGGSKGGIVGLNINGSITNCYFLKTADVNENLSGIGKNEGTSSNVEPRTDDAFHSGEVAYLLQSKQTTPVWGQNIGEDKSPVLTSDQEKNVYEVTINLNDSDSTENETRYTNSDLQALTPTREGYTFDGWYESADCSGEAVTTITDLTATLYAKWKANEYKVTLHTNDGTIAEGQNVTSYIYGVGAKLPTENEITKTGYIFAGWYNNADLTGDPVAAIGKDAMGDKTYWAKWEEVENPEPDPTPTPTPDPEPSGPSTGDSSGWDDIRDELENAENGDQITIDMGDETKVPAEIFESLAGKDVEISFDLGDIQWSVNGADIPTDTDFTDLDLGASLGTSGIPVNVINTITGERDTVQMTLAHNGDFGFTMTLTAPLGVENAGYWANLYHYDEDAEALNFETAAEIDADGSVSLPMSHASQYAIVIDTHSHAAVDVSDLFIDIAPDAWYKDAIQYAYDNGLMTGVSDTEFAPEATTTRAMIVSILARLENVTTAEAAGFADVTDEWYATAVNWAASAGVVNGYEDNTFRPNTAITREQLAAILMNYAAYKGEDVSNRADLTSYTDQPSTWAQETMQWAVAEGLISGVTADTLQPQGAATRAQVAAILQRFLSE